VPLQDFVMKRFFGLMVPVK